MTEAEYAQDQQRAAYHWEARRDGLVVAAEVLPDASRSRASLAEIARPFDLHAIPLRRTLPCVWVQIDAGDTPIWEHFVARRLPFGGGSVKERETLLFGRRRADGREEILIVLPSGESIPTSSLAIAKATILEGSALFG